MSGIGAIFNLDGSALELNLLEQMAQAAKHRGPHGIHTWHEGPIGIVQLFLHTTPESLNVSQMVTDAAQRYVLAADARIDNRQETIDFLRSKGIRLPDDLSDEALILQAYQLWKGDTPRHLVGDFAFVVWDREEKTLFCARDALGVKQLYFSQAGQTLVVATELAQILVHPSVRRDLDGAFIGNYLVLNWVEPERTMFAHIQALPAAHSLLAGPEGVSKTRYWDSFNGSEIRYSTGEEYAQHFRELFGRSIRDRLRTTSDTVGIQLSGGLDSGSVASMIQKKLSREPGIPRLKAFSLLYDHFPAADERAYIQALERELPLEVEYFLADDYWFLRDPEMYQPSLETPTMGTEELSQQIYSKMQVAGIQVFLTGHGGDHLMTGSATVYLDRFTRGDVSVLAELAEHAREWQQPYRKLAYQHLLRPLAPDRLVNAYRSLRGKTTQEEYPAWLRKDFIEKYDLSERGKESLPHHGAHSRARSALMHQVELVPFYTSYQDGSASLVGLEARHPFLDRRLVEYVVQIPQDQHYRAGWRKALLRRSMQNILPVSISSRKDKATADAFFHFSLREKEIKAVTDLFKNPILGIIGVVDPTALREAFRIYCSAHNPRQFFSTWITTNPWQIVCLELWLRKYGGMIA